jgi:drug/metabolite transporter (DMT)-like permease
MAAVREHERSPAQPANAVRAGAWMLGTVSSFVLMIVAVRELSTIMSSFELLSFRSIVGIPVMLCVAWYMGFRRLKTRRPGIQVARNVIHFAAQWCWVIGLTLLPIGNVIALEFTMPMWTAVIAALFLGERLRRHRLAGIALGFAGTMVILRPGIEIVTEAALVVLLGAVLYAASNVMVKALTSNDPPWVIVFWMQVIQLPLALGPAVFYFDWVWPTWTDAPWVLLMGVTGITAHFCMARAFRLADATLCVPFDFIRLPFAVLVGWLVYSEAVDHWILAGAVLIFAGNYYAIWQETREPRR